MNKPRALEKDMTIALIAPSGARNNDIILPRPRLFGRNRGIG